jgi:two-component system, sensor histidine kinase and response regulator
MRLGAARALRDFSINLPDINGQVCFEIDQAASGEEALERIQAQSPDILLLDHKLPGISGLDVLERIADRTSDILTVMITAYASLETAVTATKRGAYDFLAKPFTPNELKAAVQKAARHLVLQREARRLAEEKRQVRFQFISVLAHELKAPISAIQGYLQILKDRTAGDDPTVYEHMMDRSLIRLDGMRKLILDLLDLTAIESGQKTRELTTLDVGEVAKQCVETFTPAASEREMALELHCDAPVQMDADRSEIEIILNNLVSNAVKYNRDRGRVDVTVRENEGEIVLTVEDTGIGMTPEDAERLFGEFVRIKNDKTRNILGSGLGLSIVKKLAMLYGGNVRVTSQPDVGTKFIVTLRSCTPLEEPDGTSKDSQLAT